MYAGVGHISYLAIQESDILSKIPGPLPQDRMSKIKVSPIGMFSFLLRIAEEQRQLNEPGAGLIQA